MAVKICLDAGHYAKYNQSPAVKSYYESEMNWKLHLLLKKYLEEYGIEVTQTRQDQKKDLDLYARGQCGAGCDLLLSIHSNAVNSSVNESVDYPVAYVSINGKGTELGKKLAKCVRDTMDTVQKEDCWSKKGTYGDYDWFSVIHGATDAGTIGIILEHSFHTNTRSTKWLMNDSNLDRMARAEADLLAAHFGVKKPEPKTIYRVQIGAYTIKLNATLQLAKVKKAGFTDAFIVKTDKYYKVQVGAYEVKANADAMLKKVKAAGFDAFITTSSGEQLPSEPAPVVEGYTQTQFIKDIQKACGATVTGVADTATLNKTVTLSASVNIKHAAVLPVQKRLKELGYTEVGTTDGIAGKKFTAAVKKYQKDHGCTSDGEITAKKTTWKRLLGL